MDLESEEQECKILDKVIVPIFKHIQNSKQYDDHPMSSSLI